MTIVIFRLGHRLHRDERITTHCGLVARAFGADEIIFTGRHDENVIKSIANISEKWGSKFKANYQKNWKKVIKQYKKDGFKIVHLTMYGIPVQDNIKKIRNENLLVVIGGEKVPGEIYSLSDYNISVTNQPHSEVAALAVFLHEYFSGKELNKKFNGKIKVIPQEKGKHIIKL